MEILFWASILILFHVYYGYLLILKLLARITGKSDNPNEKMAEYPKVTILITAHNEEAVIEKRLKNLASQNYPSDKLEIIVASDGSTDKTNEFVSKIAEKNKTILLIPTEKLGKSGAQNLAIPSAKGEIIVMTDADTVFAPDFIAEIIKPFADPNVGGVTGMLEFQKQPDVISENQSYYWSYELKLRELESKLGILAVSSGPVLAIRKEFFREIPAHVGDDCIIPLDIILQDKKMIHQKSAKAYDILEHEDLREFRTRSRMVMRNWTGTWLRPTLLNPLHNPGYAFALWSHKLLRWLGSILLITATISSLYLTTASYIYIISTISIITSYFLALAGYKRKSIPLSGAAYSFLLANAGFLHGLVRAITGQSISSYKSGQ